VRTAFSRKLIDGGVQRVHSPEAYQTASYDIAAGHREAVDAKLASGGSKKENGL
jgi:hypothetical protein